MKNTNRPAAAAADRVARVASVVETCRALFQDQIEPAVAFERASVLLSKCGRRALVGWLAANDPNGSYGNGDRAEGLEPLTLDDAIALVLDAALDR